MKRLIIFALLLAGTVARAQQHGEIIVFSIDAGARAFDTYATYRNISQGGHDTLPAAIAGNPARMALYSAAIVGVDYAVFRLLRRHHHPKLAYAFVIGDAAQDTYAASTNFWLPGRLPARREKKWSTSR